MMRRLWLNLLLAPSCAFLGVFACGRETRQFGSSGQDGGAGSAGGAISGAAQGGEVDGPSGGDALSGSAAGGQGSTANSGEGGDASTSSGGEGGAAATTCVDPASDVDNCGACGNACPTSAISGAIRTCSNGVCGAACPAGSLGDGVNVCIPATTVAAGQKFTCALLNTGRVSCWGDTSGGIEPVAAGVSTQSFKSLSAQGDQVCGLRDTGQIVCWGVAPSTHVGPYIALATGLHHTCAIRANQSLDCWSWDNDTVIEQEPTSKYKGIASMNHYSCAIVAGGAQDGKLNCWGDNPDVNVRPAPMNETFKRVVGGVAHACGIKTDQTIMCWGLLYYPSFPASTTFKTLGNGGSTHYCGILSLDDSIFCWGSDGGIGGPNVSPPAASGGFKALALGGNHTCGIATDGKAVCSGDVTYGQAQNQPGPFQGYW